MEVGTRMLDDAEVEEPTLEDEMTPTPAEKSD